MTVASAAAYSVGNFIGVVENEGATQIIAVGKITNITGLVITVDAWDGSPSLVSAIPAGVDDFVYRLNGSAAQLGTITTSIVATSLTHTSVLSNIENGYTIYVLDDGNLRIDATTYMGNVADGTVTAGSNEYGARYLERAQPVPGATLPLQLPRGPFKNRILLQIMIESDLYIRRL